MLQRASDAELRAQLGGDELVDCSVVIVGQDLHGDCRLASAPQLPAQRTAVRAVRQESGLAVWAGHGTALTGRGPR